MNNFHPLEVVGLGSETQLFFIEFALIYVSLADEGLMNDAKLLSSVQSFQ